MEIVRIRDGLADVAGSRQWDVVVRVGDVIDCATFSPTPGTLFHGTPVNPDIMGEFIRPHQAQHRINGQRINHGSQAAVSTSSDLVFPVIRSLLHGDHETLAGQNFPIMLNRMENKMGSASIFTWAKVIQRLAEQRSTGFVFANVAPPTSAEAFEERPDLAEWRVPERMGWDWVGRTTIEDLPSQLLVIDAPGTEAEKFLDTFTQQSLCPLELSEKLGVAVMSFMDYQRQFSKN